MLKRLFPNLRMGLGWPGQCLLCRQWCRGRCCPDCTRRLEGDDRPRCLTCGLLLPEGLAGEDGLDAWQSPSASPHFHCGRCLQKPPPLLRCVVALDYAFPWDQCLQALKFRARLEMAPLLAQSLEAALTRAHAPRLALPAATLVLPIPLSAQRLRERGFNQSLEITRHLPGRRQYRVCARTLVRTRHTQRQSELPLAERLANLRQAFAVTRPLDGQHVAVVDDVMTSGATLFEAAAALHRAGAATVQAWVVARTP